MNNQTFTFNSRKIKLSDTARIKALNALVTDAAQLEYLDKDDKVTTNQADIVAVKRLPQTPVVPVITLDEILGAEPAKSEFILNSLLEKSIFELVRSKFDAAVNGELGEWSVSLDALIEHLTPAVSASGIKVTKKAIKTIAADFAAWLEKAGKKPQAVALQLEVATNGFTVSSLMAYAPAMVEAIAANFLAFADSYETEETDAIEFMTNNLTLAMANGEEIGADDL